MTEETITYIKVCCDASATVLSLIAIVISIIALSNNSKKNKNDTLLILKGYINDARSNLSSVSLEIDKSTTANNPTEIQSAAFEEAQERLLNAYNTACLFAILLYKKVLYKLYRKKIFKTINTEGRNRTANLRVMSPMSYR